ncbi:hypothetical protein USDA257_c15260 [Sinorhizobium fredii USDA 257]|uniref:Uncharacterized protein n=1 Tax=Sinorhizobium fredii (strain USDA 257) TaxID=1185652 RepID=I3X2L0_SINF2|nr:hypothetical protein USDA257_c15260 [Sinorhizobium fredii USDA 257]
MAIALPIDYMSRIQTYRRIIMSSQRKLANQIQSRFARQLWNELLRVQTRDAASLLEARDRQEGEDRS